jgi:glucose-6-phosphate-specific signal transduction histidine kinase
MKIAGRLSSFLSSNPIERGTTMTPQDQWILQKERVLAWLRVGFAIVAVLLIQLNPTRTAGFPLLAYLSLGSFLLLEYLRGDLRFLRDGLGMRVILETEPEDLNLSDDVERDLYFVLREGLMNITRHSHASRADVALRQTENNVQGTLIDDGVGFDVTEAKNGQGLGLTSMKERIKKLKGELDITSSPGKGTTISFVLPLAANDGVPSDTV